VDVYLATTTVPTLQFLKQYDAVLTFSNYVFSNTSAYGDTLASYVDAGYGVVVALFCFASGWSIGGRFGASYYVINPGSYQVSGRNFLVPIESSHPLLNNVISLDGGTNSYRGGTWGSGAEQVAKWTDGTPLIGTRTINGVRRVDLSMYPPSSDYSAGNWNSSTNGTQIMVNALNYVTHACSKNTDCLSCTLDSCQWCLDTDTCSLATPTCDDRIIIPAHCPNHCGSHLSCTTCTDPNLNGDCTWCLDTNSCIQHKNSDSCGDAINKQKFCPTS